ncbi:undecaprenyl/decaprenyl-phosphate alpha-N-acetylglucosaminyl 1-phosphate transferase [Candidatus Collierbacteria bacterium]|nr:undecaprenyl/decaprenyl-phosphate alpha-N-acetylglucosaminyl 1-phosphate transferase [Candidatus Collierbacteria bacterium]
MMGQADLIFRPFLIALAVSLIATPLTIAIFRKLGWVVDPTKTPHPAHIHKRPVPKGGGVPIFLAILVVAALFLKPDQHLISIFAAMFLTLVVGVIDDIRGLPPLLRLGLNFGAALIVVGAGIGIAYITNPLGGVIDLSAPRLTFELLGETRQIWILSDLFALLWIPFVMNAVNWSSGVDGQVSGMVTIAAVVIGLLSFSFSADITQWPVAILAFGLAGAFAGLTIFHFYPQKIMPGYSATTLAGLLLAVLSILSTTKVGTAIMVLGLPLLDAVYTIVRRVLSGKSPFFGDRGHFHHRLLALGWGRRRIAVFYWLVTAVFGVLALSLNAKMKLFAIVGLALVLAGFFLWIYFGTSSRQSDQDSG